MSEVRLCDTPSCGKLFSIRAEGWGSATVMRNMRNPRTGRMEAQQENIDQCPECAGAIATPVKAIVAGVADPKESDGTDG